MRTPQEASFEADYWLATLDDLGAINTLVLQVANDIGANRRADALDKVLEVQDTLARLIQLTGGRARVLSTEADQWRR